MKIMLVHLRFQFLKFTFPLTLGFIRKVISPPWCKGDGLMEPLPIVLDMLQYFEKKKLRSVESL